MHAKTLMCKDFCQGETPYIRGGGTSVRAGAHPPKCYDQFITFLEGKMRQYLYIHVKA